MGGWTSSVGEAELAAAVCGWGLADAATFAAVR